MRIFALFVGLGLTGAAELVAGVWLLAGSGPALLALGALSLVAAEMVRKGLTAGG